jgi:type II secretory pathway component GspD/PulD (secretin)/Spy/CpxP family protein refolding chaperone
MIPTTLRLTASPWIMGLLVLGNWVAVASSPAIAQNAGRSSSELDLLKRPEVLDQLGLSESQRTELENGLKAANPGREVFEPFLQRMKEEKDEAARDQIRKEMTDTIARSREESVEAAIAKLDSRQLKLLRSRFIEEAGYRALSDPRVARDLSVTDEQKQKLEELTTARREASAELGFQATEEQRDAFRKEWEAKFLSVLTPEQRKTWDSQLQAGTTVAATVPSSAANPAMANAAGGNATSFETGVPGTVVAGSEPPAGAEVVASFGPALDAAGEDEVVSKFSFNFRYAPWDIVLQDFARGAGYTLDMPQTPPSTLSHIDPKEYNVDQAMDILNGYLQRRGFTLVRKDGFLVCANVQKDISPSLIPDVAITDLLSVGGENTRRVGDNELVRVEVPLEKLDVGVMAQEIEYLLGPLGTMTAFTQTGSLIIADTGANLRRIYQYVEASIKRQAPELIFKVYPITKMAAEEAELMLLAQFGMRQGVTSVAAGTNNDRDRDRRGPQPPAQASPENLQVLADSRTNSLMVTATPDQQKLIEEIIKAIDVEATNAAGFGNTGPYLRVYRVSGDAREAAASISAMMTGARMSGTVVNESGEDGTLHVFASAKEHEQVDEWIQAFGSGGAAGSVAVIALSKMDPLTAAATLRNLFISEGTRAPSIETDLYGNRVIVKGSALQVEQIRQVLRDLGEDGSGVRPKGERGSIRSYSLRGRDPQEFFQILEREWTSSEQTPIRIVVPPKAGPIRDRRAPSQNSAPPREERGGTPADVESTTQRSGFLMQHPARLDRSLVMEKEQVNPSGLRKESGYVMVSQPGPKSAAARQIPQDPAGEAVTPRESLSEDGIQIVVDGDQLLLLSENEEALDRLEELMDFLQQTIPYRTRWTVFYLQAADATEAAALLEQFIPSSSVTNTAESTGFSFGSIFRPITDSVSDLTGLSGIGPNPQTLRIIPDPRSNSLFVTGPQSLVDEAEKLLEVLDSNDIPESLRDMQPRRIEVVYADIDEIATMVSDTFKPYMEPAGGRGQQNNPLAAMFGGGGGGNGRGSEPQGVQMTLAVDRQTSALIVSSSEAIYEKVRSMVEELDESSRRANRTIRVVQLQHADASAIQGSLISLFPRVTSSPARRTPASGSGGDSGDNNRGSSSSQDPFQRMMEERMRQGSGRTGSPFGGSSPFGGGGFGGSSPFGGGGFGGSSPFGGGGTQFGGRGGGGTQFGGRGGGFGGRGGR